MSTFKEKILKELVYPAKDLNRIYTFSATIVKKYPGNFYTVEYSNDDGEKVTKYLVTVRQYNNDKAEAYKEGQDVLVEKSDNQYQIIGPQNYNSLQSESEYELKADFYSNLINTIPGYIM